MKKESYLCQTWQGQVQQVINLLNHGYYWFYTTELPEKKRKKWLLIDKRLMKLYSITDSKDIRYRRKLASMANYSYLRWHKRVIILHTLGTLADYQGHVFKDFRDTPLELPISDKDGGLRLKIGKSSDGFTTYIARSSFKELKALLIGSIQNRNVDDVKFRFNNLAYLPGYSGVYKQRLSLLNTIKTEFKVRGIKFKRSDFNLTAVRRSIKVFV